MVVTIWNEYRHEKTEPRCAEVYPNGIHACIAEFLKADDLEIHLAALDDPENGLPEELLNRTDVLLWWGHMAHNDVPWELVRRVADRVHQGMGLICLHSAHHSRIFRTIVGCTGNLVWTDDAYERIFSVNPTHPIAAGLPEHFDLGMEETYGEPFDIPQPNETVFLSWFENGYLFRSGVVYQRGRGKIFYFQPGHETRRAFHNAYVQQIIRNAVRYVAPVKDLPPLDCPHVLPLKPDPEMWDDKVL